MSALDELLQKHNTSALDRAVISFSIDYQGDGEDAAAELLALREELSTAKACLELSEGELRFTKSELTDAKARAKTAEENWHKNEARIGKLQSALYDLFQSCSDLPFTEMNRMEKEINAASFALKGAA